MRRCFRCMNTYDNSLSYCPKCGDITIENNIRGYYIPVGTILKERYLIGEKINHGAYSITYVAWDSQAGQKVVIKEYMPRELCHRISNSLSVIQKPSEEANLSFYEGLRSFIEEAKTVATFKHVEEIITIYDVFEENNTAYYVAEYVHGMLLSKYIEKYGKMQKYMAINIITKVLEALNTIHKKGLIHRDLSPNSIFITEDNEVKIFDFGASKFVSSSYSKSLDFMLTIGYSPVEQYVTNGTRGPWTDIYSVGAILYKMLTGITPPDAMERSVKDELIMPSKIVRNLDKNIENTILNAMNIRVTDRTKSVDEFMNNLIIRKKTERYNPKKAKEDVGQLPQWTRVIIGAGFLITTIFLLFLGLGIVTFNIGDWEKYQLNHNEFRVPNITNLNLAEAEKKISDGALLTEIKGKVHSFDIVENKIIKQSVRPGKLLIKGSRISVVISAGKKKKFIPNFVGLKQEYAVKKLKSRGIKYKIVKVTSITKKGCVDSQYPLADKYIVDGEEVVLNISNGKTIKATEPQSVPSLKGMDYAKAKSILNKQNIFIEVTNRASDKKYPNNTIISQSIKPKSRVKQGTTLGVVVSSGPKTIRMPDVQYKNVAKAKKILESKGIMFKLIYNYSTSVKEGHVLYQDAKAYSMVEENKRIGIYVASNYPYSQKEENNKTEGKEEVKEKVDIKKFKGKERKDAKSYCDANDIKTTFIERANELYPSGIIYDQSYIGTIDKGSKVIFYVSK